MRKTHLSSKYNFTVMSLAAIHNSSDENISVLWHNTYWISIMREAFNYECQLVWNWKQPTHTKSRKLKVSSYKNNRLSLPGTALVLLFDPASLKVVTGIMTHRNLSRLRSVNFILFMTVLFLLRMRKITFVFHAGSWPENYGWLSEKRLHRWSCRIHLSLKSIPTK